MRERITQIEMDYADACENAIFFGDAIDSPGFYRKCDLLRKTYQRAYRRACERRDNIEMLLTLPFPLLRLLPGYSCP